MTRLAPVLTLLACLVLPLESAAEVITFRATLDGSSESPPNDSPGTGSALAIYDSEAQTLRLIVEFEDLVSDTTAAHVHCCVVPPGDTAGVAVHPPSLLGFPLGVTFGTYDQTFDLTLASSFSPAFITNFAGGVLADAEAALIAGMLAGQAYFNIHTTTYPGGEIRGFFREVPEPGTLALLGLASLAALRRRVGA